MSNLKNFMANANISITASSLNKTPCHNMLIHKTSILYFFSRNSDKNLHICNAKDLQLLPVRFQGIRQVWNEFKK